MAVFLTRDSGQPLVVGSSGAHERRQDCSVQNTDPEPGDPIARQAGLLHLGLQIQRYGSLQSPSEPIVPFISHKSPPQRLFNGHTILSTSLECSCHYSPFSQTEKNKMQPREVGKSFSRIASKWQAKYTNLDLAASEPSEFFTTTKIPLSVSGIHLRKSVIRR